MRKVSNGLVTTVVLLLLAALASAVSSLRDGSHGNKDRSGYHGNKDRSGYQVLRIHAAEQDVMDVVDIARRHIQTEEWLEASPTQNYVDVMVSPAESVSLRASLRDASLDTTVLIGDVQQRIQRHTVNKRDAAERFSYLKFNSFEDIEQELERIAEEFKDLTKLEILGQTYEGRNVYLLRVSQNVSNPEIGRKPIILIDGGVHAREWVSVSTVLYMINELVSGRGYFTGDLLSTFEFAFIPVLNPDGYVETWEGDRMWRKNKVPNIGSDCLGVDLNRNWGYQWGGTGASRNPCAQDYMGRSAFSENETAAVRDWVEENRGNILVYINFHAYGQLWMTPFGYGLETPSNEVEIMKYGRAAARAIKSVRGTDYIVGPVFTTIYPASSISVDWMSGDQGIPLAYTVELPDKGSSGFLITEEQIGPIGEETWIGLQTFANKIANDKKLMKRL